MADPRQWNATSGELPWSSSAREDRQFAVIAALVAVIFLPVAFWIPSLHVPEIERSELNRFHHNWLVWWNGQNRLWLLNRNRRNQNQSLKKSRFLNPSQNPRLQSLRLN